MAGVVVEEGRAVRIGIRERVSRAKQDCIDPYGPTSMGALRESRCRQGQAGQAHAADRGEPQGPFGRGRRRPKASATASSTSTAKPVKQDLGGMIHCSGHTLFLLPSCSTKWDHFNRGQPT